MPQTSGNPGNSSIKNTRGTTNGGQYESYANQNRTPDLSHSVCAQTGGKAAKGNEQALNEREGGERRGGGGRRMEGEREREGGGNERGRER